MLRSKRASAGNDGLGRAESRPSRKGPISLGMKQMGARSAGNPHAACDVAGAGNVARPRWSNTRTKERANREHKLRPKPARQSPTLSLPTRRTTAFADCDLDHSNSITIVSLR